MTTVYHDIDSIKLRISLVEKCLGDLSKTKEKIAFKSLHNESYVVQMKYFEKEEEYKVNQILAIKDLNKKVIRLQIELEELYTLLSNKKSHNDEIERLIRSSEIERLISSSEIERKYHPNQAIHFVPVYRPNGIGGFLVGPKSNYEVPFSSNLNSAFMRI